MSAIALPDSGLLPVYVLTALAVAIHLSETCDDDQCHLITNVMTTTAAVHEAKCTQDIHQSLVNKQLAPDEHFVDAAYVNAQLLLQAQER